MGASVKIMLSHDYCHFEICKSTDQDLTDAEINAMRKDVQRLADEAVRQFILAKEIALKRQGADKIRHDKEVIRIKEKLKNGGSLTIEEQATMKLDQDLEWQKQFDYDYDDDDQPVWV